MPVIGVLNKFPELFVGGFVSFTMCVIDPKKFPTSLGMITLRYFRLLF